MGALRGRAAALAVLWLALCGAVVARSDVLRLIALGLLLVGAGILLLVQRVVPGRWQK